MTENLPTSDDANPAAQAAPCPCGLGPSYAQCCGVFHSGQATAPTAERLMRSRYTAFAVGDASYLLRTWHPSTRPSELELDPDLVWKRLVIEARTGGGVGANTATVTFTAIARDAEGRHPQREHSRFLREQNRWYYVDGDALEG